MSDIEEITCDPYLHMGYVRSDARITEKMRIYEERSQRGDFYRGFSAKAWLQTVWDKHRSEPRIQVHPIPEAYPSRVRSYVGAYPPSLWFHQYMWIPNLISIVTVTHNSQFPLEELLVSWKQNPPGMPCEWIIVDNASQKVQQAFLRGLQGQRIGNTPITVIQNETNKKFTAATNQGMQQGRGEYFLFLNPDIVLTEPNWAKHLVSDMQRIPGGNIVGCKQLYPDGTIQHAGGTYKVCEVSGRLGPEHRGAEVHSRTGETDSGQYDTLEDVPWVTGSAMLVHRRVTIAIGLLDEITYPHYGSDRIFCETARSHGFKVVYSPVSMIHKHGQSSPVQ